MVLQTLEFDVSYEKWTFTGEKEEIYRGERHFAGNLIGEIVLGEEVRLNNFERFW